MTVSTPLHTASSADLVDANHILAHFGIVDAFGHVSMRHPLDAERFLLARNLAPALVKTDDILEFDLAGQPMTGMGQALYLERFIHSEIYRARPDVMAVVHSHAAAVLPFSVVAGAPFRPACHMCGFLGAGAGIFDIGDVTAGPSDLLIRDSSLGRALAEALGATNAILMRGHGSTVVAASLKVAVYRAYYMAVNARLILEARQLGAVQFLSTEEAAAALATENQVDRPWRVWKAAADRQAAAPKAGAKNMYIAPPFWAKGRIGAAMSSSRRR